LEAATWVTPADAAAIALAVACAEAIEAGISRGGADATKALYLGPHLLNALHALGATPRGRKEIAAAPEPAARTTLARLRAAHVAGAAS
jgi:hypothetical protein